MKSIDLPRSMQKYLFGNLVLCLIGGVAVWSFNPGSVLRSVGSAVLASGIVGFVYFSYMRAEKRYEDIVRLVDDWGLIDIFSDRQEKERYKTKIQNSDKTIDIQAITLTRLYTDLGDELENAGKSGVDIRILLLNPESEMCDWIEQAHGEYSDLPQRIRKSAENYKSMETDNITVRYYDGLPTNYFRVDRVAFFGPYLTEPSRNTDTMLAESDKKLAESYRNNFEDIWENYSSKA